jgi:hypothetical protein
LSIHKRGTATKVPEVLDARDTEEGAVQQFGGGGVVAMVRGEVDSQIATARQYPRDIATFLDELKTMACITEDIAESCFYSLKRKNQDGSTKKIEGGSIRFAELAAAAYGNLRIQGKTTHEDDRYIYTMGTCWDVQRNVGVQIENRRRITDKNGKKYGDDMIAVTANAGVSIAVRNAIFRIVPRAFWEPILEQAKQVAIGSADTFENRKQKLVAYYGKMGVSPEQLAEYCEIPTLAELTFEGLEDLRGLATALKEGTEKLDDAFPAAKSKEAEAEKEKTVPATLDAIVQKEKPAESDVKTLAKALEAQAKAEAERKPAETTEPAQKEQEPAKEEKPAEAKPVENTEPAADGSLFGGEQKPADKGNVKPLSRKAKEKD